MPRTSPAVDFAPTPNQPETASAPIIWVRDLVHRYGDRAALNGISFQVQPAELFGLLGPNGSGKTTLFRILSTLMVPTSGSATIAGLDVVRQAAELRRSIGVVFQAQSVDPKLTAYENLWHQGHLYGLRGATLKARIDEILTRVGLLDRTNDRVETFSGGMQRRIELGKGLLHHPQVLLLDEPTTGLDPGARSDLWQYLQILRDQEKVSVIVTTHLMEEAEHCDRLAILNEGNLVAIGTPDSLTREIGSDIVLLEAAEPQVLADKISGRFHLAATVMGKQVRLEIENGHHFVPAVVEAFPGDVQSISVSKPTLEDVFIRQTGHKFWNEEQQAAQTTIKKTRSGRKH